MASAATVIDFAEAQMVSQWARNIRALGRARGLYDQDIARLVGLTPPKFSSRMSGDTRWLATEIREVARALSVPSDVIYAETEDDFRRLLVLAERSKSLPEKSRKSLSLASSRSKPDGRYANRGNPLLVTV